MSNTLYLKEFSRIITTEFKSYLEPYGFHLEQNEIEADSSYFVFCKNEQYIKIVLNLHLRDIPHYWNIILGEGNASYPEADWNAIALWRIMKHKGRQDAEEYILNGLNSDNISVLVKKGMDDLKEFGESFLKGDLELFHQIRSELNQSREPYKVYSPDKKGKYKQSYDSESEKLKKKFS